MVPESVARMLLAAEGAAGRDWIQRLPSVVRELERRWGLRVGPPFDSVESLASRWAEWIPERFDALGRPFDASIVDEAVAALTALAAWTGERIVANRDFHLGNVLAATREPWLAIDPKLLVGEAAFDTGHLALTLLGDRPTREEAAGWIERLAGLLGLDPERIWTWAFVRAVENSVWALQCGLSAEGDLLAAVALRPGRGSR